VSTSAEEGVAGIQKEGAGRAKVNLQCPPDSCCPPSTSARCLRCPPDIRCTPPPFPPGYTTQVRETSRGSLLRPSGLLAAAPAAKSLEAVKKDFSDIILPGNLHDQVGIGGGGVGGGGGEGVGIAVGSRDVVRWQGSARCAAQRPCIGHVVRRVGHRGSSWRFPLIDPPGHTSYSRTLCLTHCLAKVGV
jgi:hypothetical protein